MTLHAILQTVAIVGAAACAGAYVYAYIFKPRGDRRMHVASLLFSGIALASVPVVLSSASSGISTVGAVNLVFFLLLSSLLQAMTAFRGRKGDRRAGEQRADDRRVQDQRADEAKPARLADAA
jgi:4-hydroxybenzoate polyprenyltransferase